MCPQGVAEALARGLDIRYGQEVEQVQYGPQGVRVRCRGGEVFQGAAAVVTVSLGVLKVRKRWLAGALAPWRLHAAGPLDPPPRNLRPPQLFSFPCAE